MRWLVALLSACGSTPDEDADSYGVPLDCDDTNPQVNPGRDELCNGRDDDCDGLSDEDDAKDAARWYADVDGDGAGNPASIHRSCTPLEGMIADGSDCGPTDAAVHPGTVESCNQVDDDCDGQVDESDAADSRLWYIDGDGDGYGSERSKQGCSSPTGFAARTGDCDDAVAASHPGAVEACNRVDDDCDGTVDEGPWYRDADGDGYGSATSQACTRGHVRNRSDCDDQKASTAPNAVERCNTFDDDCDGKVDDNCVP